MNTAKSIVAASAPYDVEAVRRDFPILATQVYGKPLVYLDNGASAQKPRAVIDAVSRVYETEYANVHRGVHYLSQVATEAMEAAREKVRGFVNAAKVEEIVFVRNATEAINLVASSWGRVSLKPGDEILLTVMEHHSNIVPWQFLRETTGAVIKVAPIADDGSLIMDEFEKLVGPRTKMVAITHVSNALGTVTPIDDIIRIAHKAGAKVLVDGCQAVPHMTVDVRAMDADFYVFSSHKLYGPSGIGVLYGKEALLDAMPPYQGGGEMISSVTFEKTTYADLPFKFEAGTPNIADAIAFGAALDYVSALGLDRIAAHEHEVLAYATEKLAAMNDVRIFGTARDKAAILSFTIRDIHPHDAGTILDREGVAVRTGHHCAQPVMDRFGQPATIRASFGLYNTKAEVDALVAALKRVRESLRLMMDLRELYQEVILDHSKHPRNFGPDAHANRHAKGNNPLCGDRVEVHLQVKDGRIGDVHFEGKGCAISLASASMMTEMVKGKSAEEAREMFRKFHELVTSKGPIDAERFAELDRLAALSGVREFPMRIKCATLPWHTMQAALDGKGDEVKTE